VQNGYGGSALRVHAGAIEFYCTNGMIRGEYSSTYRKHTSGLMLDGIGNVVEKALLTFADSQKVWYDWARKPVQHEQAMNLFRVIAVSGKMRNSLTDQYMHEVDARGNNLWAVYSALTYYSSHGDGEFVLRKTVEEQDSVAAIMLQREINVARWVETNEWKAMETA
jgi:hypothetical protein